MPAGPCPLKLVATAISFVLLFLATPVMLGQAGSDPIVDQVKSQLKDPAKPFTMFVHLQVKDGMQGKFEAAFAKAVKASRKEKGCIAYDLNRDAKETTRYVLYERWKNLADLEAHLKAAHLTALLAELKELLAGAPEIKVLLPAGE
jgi:quinol monooxygenase YgiN